MTRKKINNNTQKPYLNKKKRPKNDRGICPICAKCINKTDCNNRKNLDLMRKCPKCKECADNENCDKFYISEQYSITIPVGVDEDTGRTVRKKFTGKTMNEAIYLAEKFKKDHPGGISIKSGKNPNLPKTIEEITLEFMEQKNKSGINNDNTYRTYTEILNRVKKNAGSWFERKINKISRKEVEDFLNYEREKGYAQNTLKKDYQLLKQAFGIALERKYITEDFFAGYYGIKMPKSIVKEEKVTSFLYEDFKKLLQYLYSPDFKYSHRDEFLIAIHCGLRIGEVLGLKKNDVDFEKGILHVRRTTTLDKQGHTILGDRTKTPSGVRDIALNELTEPVFRHAIQNMRENENELIFCNNKGKVFTDSALNSCLKRICTKIGITDNAHNHKLRHSYSTNIYRVGTDFKVMEEIMGHSDIRMTIDRYTDIPLEIQKKELQKYVDRVKMELGDSINEYTKEENSLKP